MIVQRERRGNLQKHQVPAEQGQPVEHLFALFARPSTLSGEEEERRVFGVSFLLEQGISALASGQDLTDIGLRPGVKAPCRQRCGMPSDSITALRSNLQRCAWTMEEGASGPFGWILSSK